MMKIIKKMNYQISKIKSNYALNLVLIKLKWCFQNLIFSKISTVYFNTKDTLKKEGKKLIPYF